MEHEPNGQGSDVSAASREHGSLQLFIRCIWVPDKLRKDGWGVDSVLGSDW